MVDFMELLYVNRRHVKVCQLLLPHCVGVDVRDSDGQTPLHVAACNAHPEITRMIIEQGADVNARDNNGWTPLYQTTLEWLGARSARDFSVTHPPLSSLSYNLEASFRAALG